MRVVLDTNVLVSGLAFAGGAPGRLVCAWRNGAITLVVSDFVLSELSRVLPRMSSRTGMSAVDLRDFLDSLRTASVIIEPDAASLAQASASGLRDPNDVPVLAIALAARADWLVTGDKDLLVLAGHFPILTPADFCTRHGL